MNPSNRASTSPGNTPAANSLPTDVLVETANSTITIDGGTRMPRAPLVVITPAANRFGNPRWTISGRMIEPIAATVATDDPEMAANRAQAMMPASARPPYRWPTIVVAKWIIRRATPPCVSSVPARMKNGIAMIPKFSMPVKSFSATDSIGTVVIVNRYVRTVSPSEIDTGMPVSIRAISSPNISAAFMPASCSGRRSLARARAAPSACAGPGRSARSL